MIRLNQVHPSHILYSTTRPVPESSRPTRFPLASQTSQNPCFQKLLSKARPSSSGPLIAKLKKQELGSNVVRPRCALHRSRQVPPVHSDRRRRFRRTRAIAYLTGIFAAQSSGRSNRTMLSPPYLARGAHDGPWRWGSYAPST